MNLRHHISFLAFLFIAFQTSLFAQVDTIEVFSRAMNKTLKAAVVLPNSHGEADKSYPAVYLLHGGSGKFSDWHKLITEEGILQKMADQHQLIIITPGVGPASYYYDSPLLDSVRYETYITKELIPHVDKNFPTIKTKEGRAITGLSMGGHGSIMISAKNPELFTAAGSMSGVMNIDTRMWTVNDNMKKLRNEAQIQMLGNINYDAPFSPYTAVGLVDKIKENGISLILDCGIDDFLIATNRQMHQLLLTNKIPHEYTERPGAHTWSYWTEALPVHMLFMATVFRKNGTLNH
jgi:S-formylglutathione hydrolase FrmB